MTAQPEHEREQLRGHLNHLYDTYVRKPRPDQPVRMGAAATNHPRPHDKALAKLETKWREQGGHPGRPIAAPSPTSCSSSGTPRPGSRRSPYKKRRHLDGGMRHDPGWAVVSALEVFDEDTGEARKAPIFSIDLLEPPTVARPRRNRRRSPGDEPGPDTPASTST